MFDWSINSWIIVAVAFLVAVSCSLLGVYLVLRRMSLISDAISHAVLPGIAIAFILSGSRAPLPMLIGAGAFGVLTTVLIEWLNRSGKIQTDAATGIVFTALFAFGVVLISAKAGMVDLDQECVLYGEIAYSPWDELIVRGNSWGVRPLWIIGFVGLLNVLFITVFYKELKISTFDAALATSLGFSASLIHYALMGLVSLTTVASFETVGAILVVAMFVVPAATAYLLSERLSGMIGWVVALSALIAAAGYAVARLLDASIAGSMTMVAGGLFGIAFLLSPKHGTIVRWIGRFGLKVRIACEDWIAQAFRAQETNQPVRKDEMASPLSHSWWLPLFLVGRGMAVKSNGNWTLTEKGMAQAREIIRRHRSWEGYLHEELNVPPDHVHRPAHDVEHYLTEDVPGSEEVWEKKRKDPHGSDIPGE